METPFDKLDEIKDEGQTSTEAMAEEQPAEGGPPPPPTNARVFDFRHGEVPQGVTVIGETKLEEQRDRSTALVVPPQTFLNCKLDLSPNGGVNINDYTLIMDVWLEDLPKDSLSLYQANYQQRPTEGEAYIIKTGGVGIFGEYGVREAWVRPKRWTRIVVTVGGSPRCMTTYVNGKLCAKVEKGVFHTADGRFAVNTESIMLFNSTKESFMPGVKVKYVEFRPFMMTLEAVKESAQLNRIYSFWEVEKEQEEQRKFEHLSLQSLYKRPPPVWIHPAFLGEFGDAFLEGTGLEGGSLYPSFAVFSMAIENGLKEQREFLNDLQHTDAQSLDAISEIFKESRDLARKFALAAKGGAQLVHFMRHFSKLVEALKEGETMVVPGGLNEHCLIYILERQEQTFRFVLINTDPLLGLSYHQATAQQAPKIKYKTCMALDNIPASRVLDDGFWALLFKLVTYASKHNTPDKIYDLLIPFLVNKPLEEALVKTMEDPDIDWRSPQRASTAYFRSVLEAFHYLMRRKGLTPLKAKLVSLAIRVQMLSMVDNDLRFVESLSDSDVRLIKMACEQVAYTAVKYTDEKVENGFNAHQLAQIKKRLDDIESAVALLPRDNEASINPPPLELNDGDKCDYQWSHHPFFDRLLREEDVDGLAGAPIRLPKYVPVDLLQLPGRVDTFEDALAAIRYCDKMCTLISVQSHTIKNTSFLKCGLIEHTFTQVVPVPKPRTSPDYKNCVWAIPLRYALQLDILILLQRIIEHFASSALSLQATRSFDAVRIIVPACIAAIADAVMRKKATDIPSEVSLHLMGHERMYGYGLSTGKFGDQSETIEVHTAELNIARTSVLDYFSDQREDIPQANQILCFENGLAPEQSTLRFLSEVCEELAFPQNDIHTYISGEQHLIIKNYPEFECYRDIAFYFKYFMNTEDEAFPPPTQWTQLHAGLRWKWGQGEYLVLAYGNFPLYCRPKKKSFTHRFPSTATPSFLTSPHEVNTEDDVLHIKNLPNFDDALGQRDSELLISYLTVPYLRLPLVLSFFSTEDRIHSLKSKKLQDVLDSVLFEPGRYLPAYLKGEPTDVPTTSPELLATPYGHLINELHRSPAGVIQSMLQLLKFALDLDIDTVYTSTVDIILYVMRTAARLSNYMSFMIDHARGRHECISAPLRDVVVTPAVLDTLEEGQSELRALLQGPVHRMLESWCYQAMKACENKEDDAVVDENTKIACNLHAHLLLLYRSVLLEDLTEDVVSTLLCAFIFLTTRHTWNMRLLSIPETEIYEVLQVQRRKLITWLRRARQSVLNNVMESAVRVTTGTGIRVKKEGDPKEFIRRWAYISGDRSVGRFTVSSARHQEYTGDKEPAVQEVSHEKELGVEIDIQTIQLTLKTSHLKALTKAIAANPDVIEIFGSHSMQAATIQSAENREWVRLIGRDHDIHHWKTPDPRTDVQINDRDYVPGELEPSEEWIIPIFEPVRLTYLTKPFPLQICLPEDPLPEDADVAYMVGIHPKLGGTWKEIFVFKTLRIVQIYNVMSHGRRFYRSLEYTTDTRFTLREMQPSTDDRMYPWPKWERHGAGHPYAAYPDPTSCVIFRSKDHPSNLSGTEEQFIPSRLLYGIVPSALLDTHLFWQDDEDNLRGYPTSNNSLHIIYVKLVRMAQVEASKTKGVCAVVRRLMKNEIGKYRATPKKRETDDEGGSSSATAMDVEEDPHDKGKDKVKETTAPGSSTSSSSSSSSSPSKEEAERKTEKTIDQEELILMNLLYAPPGTKLHSLAKVLARIENLSYVLAWTRQQDLVDAPFNVDLVELPRLKMTFHARTDEDGVVRLYSMDHVNLFVTNARSDLTTTLIQGIPHSLLLADANGEILILVPSIHPVRPFIGAAPFSTELVLDRTDKEWWDSLDTKYYLYPVHISLSFMFTPTLASALYLLLLRFLNRDYEQVYRLVNSIGTDTQFSTEEDIIFKTMGEANNDCHPNAHSSRLKISLVTIDSPVQCPWDLTKQVSRYVTKLPHVSATCHMDHDEELQLLEMCICDVDDPRFDPRIYTEYEVTLVKNRKHHLQALVDGKSSAACFVVPRMVDSGWPYNHDMTVLGATPLDWQQLSVDFAAPQALSGVMVLDTAHSFWSGDETTIGSALHLGFLFLYGLFTGSLKAKVCSKDDSHTIATLLTQLLADKNDTSLLNSILKILCQNPELCKRLPKFVDKRQMKNTHINGWVDETEPISPIDDLFSLLVPMLMMEVDNLYIPPDDYPRLPAPEPSAPVRPEGEREWILPCLSDFMCEQRVLKKSVRGVDGSGKLDLDETKQTAFATTPLLPIGLEKYIAYLSLHDLGREPVSDQLPFDVSRHPQANSEVAVSMIHRLKNDMAVYAEQMNKGQQALCLHLLEQDIETIAQNPTKADLDKPLQHIRELVGVLASIREQDATYVTSAIPFVTALANQVPLPAEAEGLGKGTTQKLGFLLRRYSGQESFMWLDYLVGALLSSRATFDLQKLNPYLEEADISRMFDVVTGIILHANRVGHINRAISDARDLLELLEAAKEKTSQGIAPEAAILAGLKQKSHSLAVNLNTQRHYMDQEKMTIEEEEKEEDEQEEAGGFIYDPRFLVFEFTWNILLRKSQVIIVREFMDSLRQGKALVKQMIMGAGKTTVVGPLLALMLGDGKSLVTQVVPPALLEFSRGIMRSTFSSIMHKRIYTLSCDRASKVDRSIFKKLSNAIKTKGVVISTPTSIKSIMLKYLEMLHLIEDPGVPSHPSMEMDAKELARVLQLFRDGVLIMDEVDLILHPLKSELNFPIGPKLDLDFHPLRWKLPIHILDAVFYAERGRMSVGFRESNRAMLILDKLKAVISKGYKQRALQHSPHIVLLDPDFYHEEMKPVMAEWLLLWLESQHLSGLTDEQMLKYITEGALFDPELAALVNETLSPTHKKMLNLSRDWLKSFLPHVLQKINRVSFGILNKADYDRAIAADPNMPRTRAKLAIPFVGKDVPSRSSEFAHPDVIIGLTILAYRYEGLRWTDFHDIVGSLRSTLTKEIGPFNERQSSRRYASWVKEAGGRVRGVHKRNEEILPEDDDEDKEVVPLRLLKRSNEEQMMKLFNLLYKLPDLIHWYLNEFIFPAYMRHQVVKLSASGQALGGEMLFGRRIGFSGTPSDLMPIELGKCGYERGSDGLMMSYLTDTKIVSYETIEEGWSVRSLLDRIATTTEPHPYHALIDTGALITGMSNYEVAAYLLSRGLKDFEGVVFLDELDRKMILVRATGRVLKLAQCGISKKRRFAFYDQVHTTGMDIQHMLSACAVLTLGKDMTFRDYSQGAFRMRGIGKGQTIKLFIIPEIERLMARELAEARMPDTGAEGVKKVLLDVAAWLVINSMRAERIQFNQLCIQNVTNVWQKNSFKNLILGRESFSVNKPLEDSFLRKCLQIFREPIDFSVEASVPVPIPFVSRIDKRIDENSGLIYTEEEKAIIQTVRNIVASRRGQEEEEVEREEDLVKDKGKVRELMSSREKLRHRRRRLLDSSGHFFDAEKVQEQEQEREQQQEQEQEQEIEIEKYVDLAYSRDHEAPTPWPFISLREQPSNLEQFYPCHEFHLYKRQPLSFPDYLLVSNNYFDKRWSGARRIKNVCMVLEWIPSTAALSSTSSASTSQQTELSPSREAALQKAYHLFDQDKSGDICKEELWQIIRSAMDVKATEEELQTIIQEFSKNNKTKDGGEALDYEAIKAFLCSGKFREEQQGRFFVVLSLAEAETIRRIMHIRLERNVIDGADATMALRCVPSGNALVDVSHCFEGAKPYQSEVAHQSFRFLDCDMYYRDEQLNVLVRALQESNTRERRIFFERVIGCRRRMNRKWEETPVAKLFALPDEFHALKQRAQSVCIRQAIKAKGMLFYDAFHLFDRNRTGIITPAQLWGAFDWLGIDLAAEDILDFIRTADKSGDGNISYREFLDMVRDPDAKFEELEEENEPQEESQKSGTGLYDETVVQPKGEEELLRLKRQQMAEEKRIEEEEAEKEKEFERKIRREIDEEEEEIDRQRGANPKLLGPGSIQYDFTTGQRPRRMTSRGDIAYKEEFQSKYLRVYRLGVLFLPIPFANEGNGGGRSLNQYTVTMEIKLDELPQTKLALFSTAVHNETAAMVYVRSDGLVGVGDNFGKQEEHRVRTGAWHIVSIAVDCSTEKKRVDVFLDGKLVTTAHSEEEIYVDSPFYSVQEQICLFGSKNTAETFGANVKNVWFENRTFAPEEVEMLYESIQMERQWTCQFCTFKNPLSSIECSVCGRFNL